MLLSSIIKKIIHSKYFSPRCTIRTAELHTYNTYTPCLNKTSGLDALYKPMQLPYYNHISENHVKKKTELICIQGTFQANIPTFITYFEKLSIMLFLL